VRPIILACTLLAGACSNDDCMDDRRVVEVSGGTRELSEALLQLYRNEGYNCRSEGSIRDAFGRVIGTRYVCAKCI